ncbi:MAG: hypothetical protein AAGC71_09260 [Pseudomonadota bacterium]
MEQLGLISAVLGGFAFTFLSALIAMPSGRRSIDVLFLFAVLASAQFFVCALGWSLMTWASGSPDINPASGVPTELAAEHRLLSILFIGGIGALTVCLGVVGWVRSVSAGVVTALIALAGSIASVFVLRNFIA